MFLPEKKNMIFLKGSQTWGACPNERIMKMKVAWNNGGMILAEENQSIGENPTRFHLVQRKSHANCLGTELRSAT